VVSSKLLRLEVSRDEWMDGEAERIFHGSPRFIKRMERAHAGALEPLSTCRRQARLRARLASQALQTE